MMTPCQIESILWNQYILTSTLIILNLVLNPNYTRPTDQLQLLLSLVQLSSFLSSAELCYFIISSFGPSFKMSGLPFLYSKITLERASLKGGHSFPKNKLLTYLTFWLVSYISGGFPICEMNFHRFFPKNLWAKKEKSMKKLSPTFLCLLGLWYSKLMSGSYD